MTWKNWIDQCKRTGRWQELISLRSAGRNAQTPGSKKRFGRCVCVCVHSSVSLTSLWPNNLLSLLVKHVCWKTPQKITIRVIQRLAWLLFKQACFILKHLTACSLQMCDAGIKTQQTRLFRSQSRSDWIWEKREVVCRLKLKFFSGYPDAKYVNLMDWVKFAYWVFGDSDCLKMGHA